MAGTVTVHRTRFTESELEIRDADGNVTELADIPYDEAHTSTEAHDGLTAREACELIRGEGLTFEAAYRRARELADGGSWCVDVVRVPVDGFPSGYDTMRALLAGEGSTVAGTGLTLRRIMAAPDGVTLMYVTTDGLEVVDHLTRRAVTA